MASSTGSLPPPSPSPLVHVSGAGLDGAEEVTSLQQSAPPAIPPLTTSVVTSEDDKVEVLHLIADSVAQQRQFASTAILYHPLILAIDVAILGMLYKWLYHGDRADWLIIMTTFTGLFMASLVAVRLLTKGFIEEAESVGTWTWLNKGRDENNDSIIGDADELILSRFGDQPVGALILRGVRDISPTHSRSSSAGSTASSTAAAPTSTPTATTNRKQRRQATSNSRNAPVTGCIRGWSVRNRYRRKGVGTELLEEAIKICQAKGWSGPEIDADHANSKRHLPGLFVGPFDKRDFKARTLLERTKDDLGVYAVVGAQKGKRRR
jgi:ribosomal protein S18 acetylase RimI-like enzyme